MAQDANPSVKTLELTVSTEEFSQLMFALVMTIRELDKLYQGLGESPKATEQSIFLQSQIADLSALVHKLEIYVQEGALINLIERNLP
jgi:hypothetical protein